MIEMGQSKGRFANVATILLITINISLPVKIRASSKASWGQFRGQLRARLLPRIPILQIKNNYACAREAGFRTGVLGQRNLGSAIAGNHPHVGVTIDDSGRSACTTSSNGSG